LSGAARVALWPILVQALVLGVVGSARAAPSTGLAADRFAVGVGPSVLLGAEGAATTPFGWMAWATALSYVSEPLRLQNRFSGEVVSRPVSHQLTLDLGLEAGLWKRIALAVGVPVVVSAAGDRLRGVSDDDRPLASASGGDLRIRLKVLLAGAGEGRAGGVDLHLALQLQLTAPLGGQSDFAATDGVTVEPRLVFDLSPTPRLLLVGAVGVRFAPDRQVFATQLGDELTWLAGATLGLFARGQVHGALVAEAAGAVGATIHPAEARAAFRLGLGAISVDLGAGAGLNHEVTAPAWRLLLAVRGGFGLTAAKRQESKGSLR